MGITLRGTGGLGQRAGELGGQELRSKINREINLFLQDLAPIYVILLPRVH